MLLATALSSREAPAIILYYSQMISSLHVDSESAVEISATAFLTLLYKSRSCNTDSTYLHFCTATSEAVTADHTGRTQQRQLTHSQNLSIFRIHSHWTPRAGMDSQGSLSPAPGSTQDYAKFKGYFWEHFPVYLKYCRGTCILQAASFS